VSWHDHTENTRPAAMSSQLPIPLPVIHFIWCLVPTCHAAVMSSWLPITLAVIHFAACHSFHLVSCPYLSCSCHVFLASHPTCCPSFCCLLFHSILCYLRVAMPFPNITCLAIAASCLVTFSHSFHVSVSLCSVSTCCISLHFVLCYLGLPFLCWH
jgi:hypothetical protein